MGLNRRGGVFNGDSLREVRRIPRRALRVAPALLALCCACSDGGATAQDLAAIEREAMAEGAESDTSGSLARQAVRDTLRQVVGACDRYGAEIGSIFWRPELASYLFLYESYIGGTFPAGTAELLRKIQELEDSYLAQIHGFPEVLAVNLEERGVPENRRQAVVKEMAGAFAADRQPIVKAVELHRRLIEGAAELYELIASQPDSIRYTRAGLEISDPALRERYDAQVDVVNDANDDALVAIAELDPERQKSVSWLTLIQRMPR